MVADTDVLIVGAGPAGLSLALALEHFGIDCTLIDKKDKPSRTSNAIGVNPRTLEIWHTLGFAQEAIDRGLKLQATELYSQDKLLNKARFDLIKSQYNFMLALPQAQSEKIMGKRLLKRGKKINWGVKLVSFVENNDGIIASCETGENHCQITARWIVGCDGYHSSVRELAGIMHYCHDLPLHFLMVDAIVKGNIGKSSVNLILHDDGLVFTLPMQDSMRIVVEISEDPENKHLKTCEPEIFKQIVKKRHPGLHIDQITWASAFYIHECIADQYIKGRVMIAGDAAHTHSPLGGQGMNTGIQDAWNLAWKLAQVIKKEAKVQLLETYHVERHQIGKNVLNRTGKITSLATVRNPIVKVIRDFGIEHLVDLTFIAARLTNGIAQTDICYEDSSLVASDQVTEHEVLKYANYPAQWVLLTKEGGALTAALPKFVHIEQIKGEQLKGHKYCLVRPDGYVALYANELSIIEEYFLKNGFNF